jgi:hypothetical protein
MNLASVVLLSMTMLTNALEPSLTIQYLDEAIPAQNKRRGISEVGRLVVTIFNPTDVAQGFVLFSSINFDLYDSAGLRVSGNVEGAATAPQRDDFPLIPGRSSHCRCYYAWEDQVDGQRYVFITDRRGFMWTFGPTNDDTFSLHARYTVGSSEAKAAVELKYFKSPDIFFQKEIESERTTLKFVK